MTRERNRVPSLTVLDHGEWRIFAWDMEVLVGDRDVARKLFKIIKWTYRASKVMGDKASRGLSSLIEPETIAAWKSRFKQQVDSLRADEKSMLCRFYKSSFWFANIGLLYDRWAEEV